MTVLPTAPLDKSTDWREALSLSLARAVRDRLTGDRATSASRRQVAQIVSETLEDLLAVSTGKLPLSEQRRLVEGLTEQLSSPQQRRAADSLQDQKQDSEPPDEARLRQHERIHTIKGRVMPLLMERMDVSVAARLTSVELEVQVRAMVAEIQTELKLQLNGNEQLQIVRLIVDDMVGLGPLEPLLADEAVTDIMVNGPKQIYIERKGKLDLTDVTFRDNEHVLHVAQRIVTRIGRRVDESSPLVDARLPDGSRVNIIIPPLAIDGPSISIRKFAKRQITLDMMAKQNNISETLATVLKIASRCRMNILISGGTGSGKTTLLNAMSRLIDHGERIVTIEDAAELQLQQPHVVRLETRPASIEGSGEINMRDLVKNALRMRPDRIILGEVRGAEAIDMLQAMNTGHDGSMSTLHANTPREALTRLENMVAMSAMRLPNQAVRAAGGRCRASHRPDQPHARWHAPRDPCDGTHRHGGRGHHAAGPLYLPVPGRAQRRLADRQACLLRLSAILHHARGLLRPRRCPVGGDGMPGSDLTSSLLPMAAAFFLTIISLGGAYLFWWERAVRQRQLRVARVTGLSKEAERTLSMEHEAAFRSKEPEGALKRLEQRLSVILPNRKALQRRISRAGLNISLTSFLAMVVILGGAIAAAIHTLIGLPVATAGVIGLGASFLLLNLFIALLGHRRSERFLKQLPDAIDIMIRAVRAGLPILEGIAVVHQEFQAPLGPEFQSIRDKVHFGASLEEALWEIADRIDRPEFNFLVISISVQRETGGNLTEALDNLSRILRQREQMKLKVRALSSEARASAYILSAMPFIMAVLIYFMNPGYLDQLFIDPRGNVLLGAGLGTISVGALVMAKMVRFQI